MKYKVKWTEVIDKEQVVEAESKRDAYNLVHNGGSGEPTVLMLDIQTESIKPLEDKDNG